MAALFDSMSQKMVEVQEGEYKVPFGTVVVRKTDYGYKIVIHIDGREIGRSFAKQLALSLLGPYATRERIA